MDNTTRELMTSCAAALGETREPMLMVALSRDETGDIWGPDDRAHRIALDVLAAEAAEALLDRVVGGHTLPTPVRRNVLRHSGGNPLMIETLGHSHETWTAAGLVGDIDVPVAIYESVSKRLDAIRSGHDVIEAISVLNAPTDLATLAVVVGRSESDLAQALHALERAGLITRIRSRDTERFQICHQVYRDVIYEQITGQSRQKLHRSAYAALRSHVETIEATRPDILALHAHAAQDRANASIHALDAGEKLLRQSALIEASYFLKLANLALDSQPDDPETNRKRLRAVTGLASVERSRFGIATRISGELGHKAAQLARILGDSQAELLALNGLYAHARDGDGLSAVGPEAVELGDRYDLRVMRTAGHFFPFATRLCMQKTAIGPGEMQELCNRMAAFKAVNPSNYGPLTATVFAEASLRAGHVDMARSALETGRDIENRTGETWTSPELARLRAQCLARQGQRDAARVLRRDAFTSAAAAGSVMFALRIACDMAEDQPGAEATGRLAGALSRIVSDDDGWDMQRARVLVPG
jgi:predicted transcriptional regulator